MRVFELFNSINMDGRTNQQMDKASYRGKRPHQKINSVAVASCLLIYYLYITFSCLFVARIRGNSKGVGMTPLIYHLNFAFVNTITK